MTKGIDMGSASAFAPGLALSLAALALTGCGARETPASAQDRHEPAPTSVRLAAVDHTPVREPLVVPGLVQPHDSADLAFPVGGVVLQVFVEEGEPVREGQVLARIDASAARASLTQAQESLARAERDLARSRALSESGSLPPATYEDARTGAEVARASVAAASTGLRYTTLRAPHDGWVDARLIDEREVVGAGQPAFRITGRDNGFVLRVAVPDRAAIRLHEGDEASVTLDALEGETLTARVVDIARLPSPGSGSFDVELAIAAPEGITLRTGLVGRARIPLGATFAASVPVSALVDGRDHDAAVFTLDGERARRVPVRVAFFTGGSAVIAEGLDGVEQVITAGAERLENGARVAPVAE